MFSPTTLLRRVKKPAKSIGKAIQLVTNRPGGNLTVYHESEHRNFHGKYWKLKVTLLVVLQVALGLYRGYNLPSSEEVHADESLLYSSTINFAVIDALNIVFTSFLLFLDYRIGAKSYIYRSTEEASSNLLPVNGPRRSNDADRVPQTSYTNNLSPSNYLQVGSLKSNTAVGLLALAGFVNSYIIIFTENSQITKPIYVHFTSLFTPLFVGITLPLLTTGTFSSHQLFGLVLQICGLLSIESQILKNPIDWDSLVFLLIFTLSSSLVIVATQFTYKLHGISTHHRLNLRLFSFTFVVHIIIAIAANLFDTKRIGLPEASMYNAFSFILRSLLDIISLNLIHYCDANFLGSATLLSITLLLANQSYGQAALSINHCCSFLVAILGFCVFCLGESWGSSLPNTYYGHKHKTSSRHWKSILLIFGIFTLSIQQCLELYNEPVAEEPTYFVFEKPKIEPIRSLNADLTFIPPPQLFAVEERTCTPVTLPSAQFFTGDRMVHAFDDILLIVFFSHARYDVNLDYYKEVYAEFFPNMVFVGPKNREDRGFTHSYDVIVDSYESDEDISDWNNYQMAGRMAHHMLYTVLTTPPYSTGCYKGFLWVPFDTLLNVPRLQLFNQSQIWYFSPWAEYVPNPAINETAWKNASSHAPPARISPDPDSDFESTFRGWWKDWWWGDPHYGIPVCRKAFERIDPKLREQMALRFTKGETRYIGGSADTVYIPAHLKDPFLDILGTFLETSCFLEIAVPTAVHLILPEEENMLFVDHWWIWESPLNASFVRDTWAKGLEVDTFHTFHWGDKNSDGVWRAIPENIKDVRLLFRESAARQNVPWGSLS